MVSFRVFVIITTLCVGAMLLYYESTSRQCYNTIQNPQKLESPESDFLSVNIRQESASIDEEDEICVSMQEAIKAIPLIDQLDRRLIDYIRQKGLIRNPSTKVYNLKEPDIDPSMGQSKMILKALKNMRHGFFVECGALDGETRSNTLFMEKQLNWSGLLIEGDPKNYEKVISKNRKAFTVNACLATHPYPHEVQFKQNFNVGRISEDNDEGNVKKSNKKATYVNVQCFPFFSLLSAINVTTIDYFSLDIEGDELKVLKHLPFDEILIKTLSVEFIHGGVVPLKEFMTGKGYSLLGKVTHPGGLANDLLFAHKSISE